MRQIRNRKSAGLRCLSLASIVALGLVLGQATFSAAVEYPYRKDFPEVPAIDSEVLFKKYEQDKIIIVDVRSSIEYDVIHPEGAVHIPLSSAKFIEMVKELNKYNPDKAIAFYCNGITCLKSYVATQKALGAGLSDCYVYDAGIPIWASIYPEKTLLLGKELVDPDKQLISKADFKKKCLPFKKFKSTAKAKSSLVIDARDSIQRSEKLPGLKRVKKIPFDKFIPNFVEKKIKRDSTLLVFDQVGKQVRWLEYYLVANGYEKYYFLAGGATSVLKVQKYKK